LAAIGLVSLAFAGRVGAAHAATISTPAINTGDADQLKASS
jgi:hypothetical protein